METTPATLDLTPLLQRLDNLTDLVVFQSIIIFAILIFLAFAIALRGFYKLGK